MPAVESDGRAGFRRLNRPNMKTPSRPFRLPNLRSRTVPEDARLLDSTSPLPALDMSYVQMAKYMEAADVVLDAAIGAFDAARPTVFKGRSSFAHEL